MAISSALWSFALVLLTASHLAYTALRWIGAAYLIWMGSRMLRDTYVAVLPQFIPPGTAHFSMVLLLTTVHILIGLLRTAVLIGFTHVLHGWLRKPQARRLLDRITGTGTVIGVFGVRPAFSN